MTPVGRDLGLRLREEREKRELSQHDLSAKAGVRQATISDLESGKAKRIGFDVLEKLASALGVAPALLIARESTRRKK